MKVSIITSCYNRAGTIRCAMESVLAQDYPDIEYIIVDGASTDGSTEIIRQYEGRVARIISEPDRGMYEAINKGIRAATGDIVGLMHSDDFFFDNHVVSDIVKRFERTETDFVYGDGLLWIAMIPIGWCVIDWRKLSSLESEVRVASFASYLLYSQGCDAARGFV